MRLSDLVALSLVPAARRRLVEAAELSDQTDHSLDAAIEALQGLAVPARAGLVVSASRALARGAEAGIIPVPRDHPAYPGRLRELPDHPVLLWVRGDPVALRRTAVAIIGSRRASQPGIEIAYRLASDLGGAGVAVISGLARGCDGAAHRGALDGGGVTVAVLGSGADIVYPPEHDSLAHRIVSGGGAVISECPPGAPPLPMHFPMRNRIISGLSRGVVVIEAGEKSGSLITAACAAEQGREVMVVPGPVLAGRNRGGHQLIRDGAALVENAEDVIAVLLGAGGGVQVGAQHAAPVLEFGQHAPGSDCQPPAADCLLQGSQPPGDTVLDVLEIDDPQDLDRICARTGLSPSEVLARLSTFELSGQVVRHPGGLFVRRNAVGPNVGRAERQ